MMRLLLIILLSVIGGARGIAQEVTFTASAPGVVEVGEQFNLVFSLNQRGEDLKIVVPDEFTVLAGPSPAFKQQFVSNGSQSSSSTTYTYTYVLVAEKEGTFTIAPATIRAGGKEYTCNKLTVKVVKGEADGNAQPSRTRQRDEVRQSTATATEDDLFVRCEVSRSSLYLGEGLIATLKVYTRVPLAGIGSRYKAPSFAGFLTEEIPLPGEQRQPERVDYNGKVYETINVLQWMLSPQHTGEITIDPFELECRVSQRLAGLSEFDRFFGGGARTVSVMRRSRPVKITVKSLPEAGKPSNFNGVVGNLTLSTSISQDTIRANDAFTYKVVFRGTGNLRLLEAPKINLPHDFDVYDPKVTRNVQPQAGSTSGTVTFEYVVIPRYAGDYTLPALNYAYFNLLSQGYKTLAGNSFNVHVLKGSDAATPAGTSAVQSFKKEDVRVLGEDIRFIKTGDGTLKLKGVRFFRTTAYGVSLLVPFVLCVAGMLLNRRRIKARADLARVKSKTANKMAQKRLKAAAAAMKAKDPVHFYQEVLTATWGYVSYKLNLPASALNRDNISEHLRRRGASEEMLLQFIGVLDQCEYARYAPGSGEGEEMEKLYGEAMTIITRLNGQLTNVTKK